ncbi:MAG: nucleotide exchange factor GrpE [Legionellaceae bacterium]|nr:nucleotide exchange factor GrpE [Legionellaceae bacterium]MBP9775504.1 nucleotide exchange factor GrpE [Legionellaceae bacterium]
MSDTTKKDWKSFTEQHADADTEQVDIDMLDEDEEGGGTRTGSDAQHPPEELEHLSYEALEDKLTEAEQKAFQYRDQATRSMAELENVRRRAERDVSQAHLYSLERFSKDLLPVIDSLEQALQSVAQDSDQAMFEGLTLTMKLFLSTMEKFQVTQLDPLGLPFDPNQHEAVSMQESDAPSSSVIMVFQKGYKLNDRVIRPARVVVAK